MNEDENDGRRILVTGATGNVGGRLCRALEERGERVLLWSVRGSTSPWTTSVVAATLERRKSGRRARQRVR